MREGDWRVEERKLREGGDGARRGGGEQELVFTLGERKNVPISFSRGDGRLGLKIEGWGGAGRPKIARRESRNWKIRIVELLFSLIVDQSWDKRVRSW